MGIHIFSFYFFIFKSVFSFARGHATESMCKGSVCGLGIHGLCQTEIHGYKSRMNVILLSSRIQFPVDNRPLTVYNSGLPIA